MSLRRKIIYGATALVVVVVAVYFLLFYSQVVYSVARLEQATAQRNVQRSRAALQKDLEELTVVTRDWGEWDDMYEYVAGPYQEFEEENFLDETYIYSELNVIGVFDCAEEIVYLRGFDYETEEPLEFSRLADPNSALRQELEQCANPVSTGKMGLAETSLGPIMIASSPILYSDVTGEPRGTFMMGRLVSESLDESLSDITQEGITLYTLAEIEEDAALQERFVQLRAAGALTLEKPDSGTLVAYTSIEDLWGEPLLLLQIQSSRQVFQSSLNTLLLGLLFSILVGLIATLLLLRFVETLVVRPVRDLSLAIGRIRTLGDLSSRAKVEGAGEIAQLADHFNNVLARLENEVSARKESENRLRSIVEGSPGFFFYIRDAQGYFTYLSPSVEKITGYTPEDWMRSHATYLTDNPLNKQAVERAEQVIRERIDAISYPMEIVSADGRKLLLQVYERPILTDGQVTGVQCVAHDVTRQRALEEQLLQAQKMEIVGTLAGGIAHDFNNLLTGILGNASLALSRVGEDHDLSEDLHGLIEAAKRARDLTEQLMTFSRVAAVETQPLNLNSTVDETVQLLRRTIPTTIEIETHLAPNLAVVKANPGQMMQLLMNLCVNARDAMPDGGRLTLQTENLVIDQSYVEDHLEAQPGEYVKISVTDTGVGMDKTTRQHLFEPFFTSKELGKGTGLGLATVYGIAKSHGGWITIYSELGQGSVFNVYLPATKVKVVEEEVSIEPAVGGTETILVIDDEETVLGLAKRVLENYGYTVFTADNGLEGVEVYQKNAEQIDLVLLDVIMPGLSGRECFARLKEINPDVKVVLSSGYGGSGGGMIQGILSQGALGFVQKPYLFDDLARSVRQALDK
jgi:PAS domain S-box-containing protein